MVTNPISSAGMLNAKHIVLDFAIDESLLDSSVNGFLQELRDYIILSIRRGLENMIINGNAITGANKDSDAGISATVVSTNRSILNSYIPYQGIRYSAINAGNTTEYEVPTLTTINKGVSPDSTDTQGTVSVGRYPSALSFYAQLVERANQMEEFADFDNLILIGTQVATSFVRIIFNNRDNQDPSSDFRRSRLITIIPDSNLKPSGTGNVGIRYKKLGADGLVQATDALNKYDALWILNPRGLTWGMFGDINIRFFEDLKLRQLYFASDLKMAVSIDYPEAVSGIVKI